MRSGERVVARVDSLADGELREVDVDGVTLLLARDGERVFATQATCPHYGLKLAEGGAIVDGCIRCPWHMSRFRAADGAPLEPPAIDGLTTYACRVADGDVIVEVPTATTPRGVTPPMSRVARSTRHVAIVGNGAAGYAAAQRLRELSFDGRITLFGNERSPIDRPSLSKSRLSGEAPDAPLPLRPDAFYESHAIERSTVAIVGIDAARRRLALESGDERPYDVALLATGSSPIVPDAFRDRADNLFALREVAHADAIVAACLGASRAVVVGSSFIGMEVASCLRRRGLAVTVVSSARVPFERTLGQRVGAMCQRLHESRGVTFRLERRVTRCEGGSRIDRLILDNGSTLDADLVVHGVGVRPNTTRFANLPLLDDGGVPVDAHFLVIGHDDVFAVGDIARPTDPRTGRRMRVEHWRTAMQHGRCAAANALGLVEMLRDPPYFWSLQHDVGLDYVGHADRFEDVRIDGDVADDFFAEYLEGDRVMAIASSGRSERVVATIEAMRKDWRR